MPFGIIIVGEHQWVAWNTIHVHQPMNWGWGAWHGYWSSTGFFRWKVRPGSSWEVDLGTTRERDLLSVFVSSLPFLLGCMAFALRLSDSVPFSSLQSRFLSLFMAPLLCKPLLQLVCHRANHDHDSIQPQMPITV